VCFGMSHEAAKRLIDCGVAGIDCAGAGGTSWAKVEALCAKTERRRDMGERFGEWGIPTSRSIQNVRGVSSTVPLIACGGLRNGIDLAKALALGADIGAMARPFLLKAHESEEALDSFIADVLTELRICMFGAGAGNLSGLRGTVTPRT
jgi:isopentenyl-diphosphate Delta-isomerase